MNRTYFGMAKHYNLLILLLFQIFAFSFIQMNAWAAGITANIELSPDPLNGNDTYIDEGNPTVNQADLTDLLINGNTGKRQRALVRFGGIAIPPGISIQSAVLSLYCSSDGTVDNVSVHQVTNDWVEKEANWSMRDWTNRWDLPGGEYDGKAGDTISCVKGWNAWTVTDIVQSWVNGTTVNSGFFIIPPDTMTGDSIRFYSSDYTADPSLRPKLSITYLLSDELTVTSYDEAPVTVYPGNQDVLMQRLVLSSSNTGDSKIRVIGLGLTYLGDNILDIASKGVKIYQDINANDSVDHGVDFMLINMDLVDTSSYLDITDFTVNYGTPVTLFICYDISSVATPGNIVKNRLASEADIYITADDVKIPFTNYDSGASIIGGGAITMTPTYIPTSTPVPTDEMTSTPTPPPISYPTKTPIPGLTSTPTPDSGHHRIPVTTLIKPDAVTGQDTHIQEDFSSRNYGSSDMFSLTDEFGTNRSNILLQFDLSDICFGSEVMYASLKLYCNDVSMPGMVNVHRITTDWTENGATWNSSNGKDPWSSPGGDINTYPADTQSVSGAGWITWDVTSLAQSWLDGSYSNYGLMIRCDPSTGGMYSFFSSDYSGDEFLRPELEIIWGSRYALGSDIHDYAPPTALIGAADIAMGQLVISKNNPDTGHSTVTGLTIAFAGNSSADIAADGVRIYDDLNDNGTYDYGTDVFLGSSSFVDSEAYIDIIDKQVLHGSPARLLICYDISPAAVTGHSICARIAGPSAISINTEDCMVQFGNLVTGYTTIAGGTPAPTTTPGSVIPAGTPVCCMIIILLLSVIVVLFCDGLIR